jgi:superfamily II DNA or RNA helicase
LKFVPHDYQKFAIQYIIDHPIAAVLLDMGLGKTAITLTAIEELIHDRFEVRSALVVAPLRVARDTWPSEIEKWDHLKDLTFTVAVGSEKQRLAALKKSADIHIINRENIPWLIEKSGLPFDYDMIVIDELSFFQKPSGQTLPGIDEGPSEGQPDCRADRYPFFQWSDGPLG